MGLDGVLVSSCPWSSSGGLATYCGDGRFYQPPFQRDQVFRCNSPNYTNLGVAQKYPCTLPHATYKGQGRIQRCLNYFHCDAIADKEWGAVQDAGCIPVPPPPQPPPDPPPSPGDGGDGGGGGGSGGGSGGGGGCTYTQKEVWNKDTNTYEVVGTWIC